MTGRDCHLTSCFEMYSPHLSRAFKCGEFLIGVDFDLPVWIFAKSLSYQLKSNLSRDMKVCRFCLKEDGYQLVGEIDEEYPDFIKMVQKIFNLKVRHWLNTRASA